VINQEGWTKAAMTKLPKMDSFLKESLRLSGMSLCTSSSISTDVTQLISTVPIMRKAMRTFAFSDGTVIPSGTHVVVAMLPMHLDEAYFSDASQFHPFRFSELREDNGEDKRHLFASTSPSYVSFGYGTHAWYDKMPDLPISVLAHRLCQPRPLLRVLCDEVHHGLSCTKL